MKVTVPLLLSINAVVTFQKFSRDPIPPDMFRIPPEYTKVSLREDPPPAASSSSSKGGGGKKKALGKKGGGKS